MGTMAEVKTVKAPATLIEIAFHDNADDAFWIVNHISELAHANVLSLLELWAIPYVTNPIEYPAMREALRQIKAIASAF
jgi:hypothetical protein